jgi:hypothetical protein
MSFAAHDPYRDRVALELLRASVLDVQRTTIRAQTMIEASQSLLELAAKLNRPLLGGRRPKDAA